MTAVPGPHPILAHPTAQPSVELSMCRSVSAPDPNPLGTETHILPSHFRIGGGLVAPKFGPKPTAQASVGARAWTSIRVPPSATPGGVFTTHETPFQRRITGG